MNPEPQALLMTRSSIGHGVLVLLFVVMAALQWNDPDPLLWVTVYLGIAVIPTARILGFRSPLMFGMIAGLAAACLLVSFPGFIDFLNSGDYASIGGEMSADKPYVESAREFLGVLIGVACLRYYWRWHAASTQT